MFAIMAGLGGLGSCVFMFESVCVCACVCMRMYVCVKGLKDSQTKEREKCVLRNNGNSLHQDCFR